jgi:2-C-methyl-D-erythritol 4-phosphate cytidylyltransferase
MAVSGSVAALVLGAGRGERLGHALPKAFVSIHGSTLIEHSIRALSSSGSIDLILPVLAAADIARWLSLPLEAIDGLAEPIEGGTERQDSTQAGLEQLSEEFEFVAIHDAARCLVSAEDVRAVVSAARRTGAAILAERVRDTIKRVVDGRVVETVDRDACWAAQTPQVIRRDWLIEAIAANCSTGRRGTDDAQLIEWLGRPVHVVEAGGPNPKITRPEDLVLAEILLAERAERAKK